MFKMWLTRFQGLWLAEFAPQKFADFFPPASTHQVFGQRLVYPPTSANRRPAHLDMSEYKFQLEHLWVKKPFEKWTWKQQTTSHKTPQKETTDLCPNTCFSSENSWR